MLDLGRSRRDQGAVEHGSGAGRIELDVTDSNWIRYELDWTNQD